jgi:hypothetical protein
MCMDVTDLTFWIFTHILINDKNNTQFLPSPKEELNIKSDIGNERTKSSGLLAKIQKEDNW